MTRPWSFPVSAAPVVVTAAYLYMVEGHLNLFHFILILLGMMLFHAAGNLHSDYHDYLSGVDCEESYGVRTLIDGESTVREYRLFSSILFSVALAIGLVLVFFTDLRLIWVGLTGYLLALSYPAAKKRALGDLVIFCNFAILPIIGTTLALTMEFDCRPLIFVLPVGLVTVAVLHVNNMRDISTDKAAGVTSFAALVGMNFSKWLYVIYLAAPYLFIIGYVTVGLLSPWSLLLVCSAPLAFKNILILFDKEKRETSCLKSLDEKTARLQLINTFLLTSSILLEAWI